MKNQLLKSVLGLTLLLSACQSGGQLNAANPSSPAGPLTREAYSQQFVDLFKDYSKVSLKGTNVSAMALGAANPLSRSATVPSGASFDSMVTPLSFAGGRSVPATADAAAGSAKIPATDSQPVAPDTSAARLKPQLELFKSIMPNLLKAASQTAAKLKALTPPPELASQHAALQEYFGLIAELGQAMIAEVDSKGESGLADFSGTTFRSRFKTQLDRLEVLQPQVQKILYDFQITHFRQERLALQQGDALSSEAYKTRLQEIKPRLPNFTSGSSFAALLVPTLLGSKGPSGETAIQSALAKLRSDSQQAVDDLAKLHPPDEQEELQTLLYTTSKLNRLLILRLLDLVSTNLKDGNSNLLSLLPKVFADEDILANLMDLSIFMPRLNELNKATGAKK